MGGVASSSQAIDGRSDPKPAIVRRTQCARSSRSGRLPGQSHVAGMPPGAWLLKAHPRISNGRVRSDAGHII